MKKEIAEWFDKLELPTEWRDEVNSASLNFDFDEIESKESPYEYLAQQEDKMKCLLYALSKCGACYDYFCSKGIPDEIFFASLSELKRYAVEYYETNGGKIGILQIKWVGKVLSGLIFRLGRLEFEIRKARYDFDKLSVREGDDVLNVHIPIADSFDREVCDTSYAMSREFFAKYFPDYKYKCYACSSWLLDSELEKYLKKSSNILRFASEYEVVSSKEGYDALTYLFGRGTSLSDVDKLVPESSLQKGIVEHIKTGGKLYISYGYKSLK